MSNPNTRENTSTYMLKSCDVIINKINPYITTNYPDFHKMNNDTQMNIVYNAYMNSFPDLQTYNVSKYSVTQWYIQHCKLIFENSIVNS